LGKIRVAAVSYLNTKPLLYGIKHHPVFTDIELVEEYPARIAQMLMDDEVDIGLIPVGIIPRLPRSFINGGYCIGCDGPVVSVCIFSDVPMEEIEEVYLDYQSRTSVLLAQLLLKEYWKKDIPLLTATTEEYRDRIQGTTAGLVIGDRALVQKHHSRYCYDLGDAWKRHTRLPFVFAAWISTKKLPDDFISSFDEANRYGLQHLDEVIAENPFSWYDLKTYFTKCISYELDEGKKMGLDLFLTQIK
jgi:chorismate dehydratase